MRFHLTRLPPSAGLGGAGGRCRRRGRRPSPCRWWPAPSPSLPPEVGRPAARRRLEVRRHAAVRHGRRDAPGSGCRRCPTPAARPSRRPSLLAGSHTARVWYDGADKARVALVGDLGESDLVRNGRDVWLWSSGKNTAQHVVLPAEGAATGRVPTPAESLTPQQAADRALAAVDPTTKVTVDGTASVAGRSAYELVLAPTDSRSLVGDVRHRDRRRDQRPAAGAGVRRRCHRPAGVRDGVHLGELRVSRSAEVFRFTPPPGAKVTRRPDHPRRSGADHAGHGRTGPLRRSVVGTGLDVGVVEVPDASLAQRR